MKRDTVISGLFVLFVVVGLALLLPSLGQKTRPKLTVTRILLESVSAASSAFFYESGEWPTSLTQLTSNRSKIQFIQWGKDGTNDAWGHPLHYQPFNPSNGYGSVSSLGQDGRAGGTGKDADIEVRFGSK